MVGIMISENDDNNGPPLNGSNFGLLEPNLKYVP